MDYENSSLAREGHGANDKHADKAIDMIKLMRVIREKDDDRLKTLAEKTRSSGFFRKLLQIGIRLYFFGNRRSYKLEHILYFLKDYQISLHSHPPRKFKERFLFFKKSSYYPPIELNCEAVGRLKIA